MDLADLVGAGAVTTLAVVTKSEAGGGRRWPVWAAWTVFVVGGLAWLGLQQLLEPQALRPLTVVVAVDAAPEARVRAVDDAMLLEVGLELGWRTDPLIRDRLSRALAAMSPSEVPYLDRAEALGLHRRDPLVKARLIERARRALPVPPDPGNAVLKAFMEAEAARFERSPVLVFEQRFTTSGLRADAMWADIQAGKEPADRGEPELLFGPRATRSLEVLRRELGEEAARMLGEAAIGGWVRVHSGQGHHLLQVRERRAAVVPSFEVVRAEVLAAWRESERPAFERKLLDKLKEAFRIEVVTAAPLSLEAQ